MFWSSLIYNNCFKTSFSWRNSSTTTAGCIYSSEGLEEGAFGTSISSDIEAIVSDYFCYTAAYSNFISPFSKLTVVS